MRITQCRLKGRVTEIHLNFLQGIALMQQQRCTGVAQIVKTDFLETVPLDKAAKTIADPLGGEQTAVCQCKDVFIVGVVVAIAPEPAVFLRPLPTLEQQLSNGRHKCECTSAGFGFQFVCLHDFPLAVDTGFEHFMTNIDRVLLKINILPAQSAYLAAAQSVKRCYANNILDRGTLECLKQLVQLACRIGLRF